MIRHIPRGIAWASPCSCSCSREASVRVCGKRARDVSIDLGVWVRATVVALAPRKPRDRSGRGAPLGSDWRGARVSWKSLSLRRTRDTLTRAPLEHEHEHGLAHASRMILRYDE